MNLAGKRALVTGASRGIGAGIAKALAAEGADVAITYEKSADSAAKIVDVIKAGGRKAVAIQADSADVAAVQASVAKTVAALGGLDILVNNAAEQHPQDSLEQITSEQLERTFRTNIFSYFYMGKAALRYLKEGSTIINTTSVTAYKGNPQLLDYSSTKGAIVAFTRSLSQALAEKQIRVNAVAPGPIWTPLIPSTFPADKVATFGSDVPLKRAGQPEEVAPSYVFLASQDSSYTTGQVLHPNGGTVVNG
jgi:NAD(P)-dependent dehydrogenase (short-subunit alcohol dehydrogenase family)